MAAVIVSSMASGVKAKPPEPAERHADPRAHLEGADQHVNDAAALLGEEAALRAEREAKADEGWRAEHPEPDLGEED